MSPTNMLSEMAMKEYYLVREVAEHFRLSPRTIYRLIERGELAATRIGGSQRIPASEISNYKPRRRRRKKMKPCPKKSVN